MEAYDVGQGVAEDHEELDGEKAIRAVQNYLAGRPLTSGPNDDPWNTVVSHFVNPLRSLAAVQRFINRKSGCLMFRTPDETHNEWCVLQEFDPEIKSAHDRLSNRQPPRDGYVWKYMLTQRLSEGGAWRHDFCLALDDQVYRESSTIPPSIGWNPRISGVRFFLRDISIGDDVARLVPRHELLHGLAQHIAGHTNSFLILKQFRFASDEDATVQMSREGIEYFVYTPWNGGPTHIFSASER